MLTLLDDGAVRGLGYLLVACVALAHGLRERARVPDPEPDWWPTYWWCAAGVLLTLSLAVGGSLGDWLAELGRARARSGGWYDARRTLQATAVGGIAVGWVAGVLLAIWRVPPRRRRYLPHATVVSALLAFAGARAVSLHQLDALLYRRELAGVRVVAWVEVVLLLVALVVGPSAARRETPRRARTTRLR